MPPRPPYIGRPLPDLRSERSLRGQGAYVADIELPDALHVAFLRSPVAFGTIVDLDLSSALDVACVLAAHGGKDVSGLGKLSVNPVIEMLTSPSYPILAQQVVQAVGQPVAAVLGTSADSALDGCEAIRLAVDESGPPPAPDAVARQAWSNGDTKDAFANADIVVECQLQHPRLAPSPMEPRGIAVRYEPATDGVTIWHSTQTPHRTRKELAAILEIAPERITVIADCVGGAFGMKASLYPEEIFTVWAALEHKRSTRWVATRSEDFLSATQGRGVTSYGRLALSKDGQFLGLEARTDAPVGRWLPNSGLVTAWNAARILPGGYVVPSLEVETQATAQNLAPTGIYRGAGRPEANCLMERLVDKAAKASGIDPLEIRKRNLTPAHSLPSKTATGNVLDSGDYANALNLLRQHAGYDEALRIRDERRQRGALAGVGIAFYLEPSGNGWESAEVSWQSDGTIIVASGSSSQGHGRETAFAQIAADTLQVDFDAVTVRCGDTAHCPEGIGALASRSTPIGGSAVLRACNDLRAQIEAGADLPVTARCQYENDGQAWGYGCYMVSLEIDHETGEITLDRVTCVDDAGRIINPAQVHGQIRGGFAQGLGEALLEQVIYDEDGQLVTGSFMDYAMPRAVDLPPLDIHTAQTPSPLNALGAKGVGEAGTIGAPPAILNAVLDALAPLGIEDMDMPLTPSKLWQAITSAEQETAR
ncbi:xanthine dehydrogenase family protein molybdopterin-binding subunit [Litoreibacter janthinus]|uniref:Xanthine dehydrogenase, molybdenum binding subunit apoprotein n=1 Tax=Litoreibacter janthinus TaxID=670154 RepID=A0A1I6GEQ4_9RHOB|nr:xanthine dehydrogenase family protein molybdopterin-binding subunit [Litoreibacter janthinus]SFR40567.1 xanthine dehydrogenase, molybdenum binding subunit apoprotein [Litoreibacter janthinus]